MRKKLSKSMLIVCVVAVAIFAAGCRTLAKKPVITINPQNCVIVWPQNADGVKKFAATELQKHLELITGCRIPLIEKGKDYKGKYPLYVGIIPSSDDKKLKKEEARYLISAKHAYIYGEDNVYWKNKSHAKVATQMKYNRTGTLFAVYAFLENEFGIKWLEPGDKGIVYKPVKTLTLHEGQYDWTTKLIQRGIRSNSWRWKYVKKRQESIPTSMRISQAEAAKRAMDELIWLKRMRMGRHLLLNYGHAFTKWWDKYGKTHPEYFAMSPDGKRYPYANGGKPDRVKICPSCEKLQKKLVEQWAKRYKKDPDRNKTLNVCENDSAGYCHCPACMKLDAPMKKGEKFGDFMTDRYIHFANSVLKKAQKIDPDVKVVMYAYSVYRYPPRKTKVSDGVILGFVPRLMQPCSELDENYKQWRKSGAKEMFLRPNDMHIDTGLPMGFEKKMFDNFKAGIANGIIGTDYDSLHSYWDTSGIANYILARAHIHPEQSFEYWEDEYCSAYGAAKNDVKRYYKYWRNIWDTKLMADRAKIAEAGRYGNFRRGLMWCLPKYYSDADFDATEKILSDASKRKLSELERIRLKKLILANRHARLTYEAIRANNRNTGSKDPLKRIESSRALLNFRMKNKDALTTNWSLLFDIEKSFGDVTGVQFSRIFTDKLDPVLGLPIYWRFKMDPKNIGEKQHWEKEQWKGIVKNWKNIRTDRAWEQQKKIDPELAKKLKSYDGIGWYATRFKVNSELRSKKIYALFGAVDESCWVYLNGKFVGKHIFSKSDDWKTPFTIELTKAIDWSKSRQLLVVRVEDKAGLGGIWKICWIAKAK